MPRHLDMGCPPRVIGCVLSCALCVLSLAVNAALPESTFAFALLGDRTGEPVPGVYEQVWRDIDRDRPAFVLNVGDTIQGGDDLTVDAEWRHILDMLAPYRKYRIFYTPGNHDVWSLASADAFTKYTKDALHYGFDYKQAHFTILDNSRSDEMPAAEIAFLRNDLEAHAAQPIKFIVSHRPSWILQVVLGNPNFPLHQLARKYGVQYVIAGHLHQMLHFELDGITYLSMVSAGGHLRNDKQYDKGWFFGHTIVTVRGSTASFAIKETGPPFGESRITTLANWGPAGLVQTPAAAAH